MAGDAGLPGIRAIERATLAAVPAPRLLFEGPFVVRTFLGGTGRANSACSLDPAEDPALPERVARVEAFYARFGRACRFRSTPLDPIGLGPLLLGRGYREVDESQVLCGPLAGFARADDAVTVLDGPDPEWMEVVGTAEHQVPARRAEKLGMKDLLGMPAAWLLLHEGGVPAACAFATADGPLAGLFDLAVRPEFRRRGLGQRVMAAAGCWARGMGAEFAYAQVSCANAASLALNAGLGLRERYRYRYLVRA
ncbi:GNAT family N-acetyltransferase [Falsiroseomonas sp. CW058]|uniref:GNAT family N-acetyltransferase n=1 Tax=Falsiroseomonas sp. CW058 TaxID=3388664 RepID=UPI003D320E4D